MWRTSIGNPDTGVGEFFTLEQMEAARDASAVGSVEWAFFAMNAGAAVGGYETGAAAVRVGSDVPVTARVNIEVPAKVEPSRHAEPEAPPQVETPSAPSYESLLPAAQAAYPTKAGKIEKHHIWPKYMNGPGNGPLAAIDAAYHQLITNYFRELVPYGTGRSLTEQQAQAAMDLVYARYPLPRLN
jgi:hypothetical protein